MRKGGCLHTCPLPPASRDTHDPSSPSAPVAPPPPFLPPSPPPPLPPPLSHHPVVCGPCGREVGGGRPDLRRRCDVPRVGCSRGAGAGGSPPPRSPPVPCIAHGCQCCGATGSFTPSRHHFLRAAVCNAAALRGQPARHCLWAPCRARWCRSGTAAGGAVTRSCPSIHLVRPVAAVVAATHGFPPVALVRVEGWGAGHWVVVLMEGDGAAPSRAQTPPLPPTRAPQ